MTGCRASGARTHIVHHSAASALDQLRAARAEGLPLTAETCPHYLHFTAESIPDGATPFKCAPPIRDAANREALWRALAEGVLDLVASDHSPCSPGLKAIEAGDFVAAWGGIPAYVALSVVWTEARRAEGTLGDLARWMRRRRSSRGSAQRADGRRSRDPRSDATFGGHARHRHPITPYATRVPRRSSLPSRR